MLRSHLSALHNDHILIWLISRCPSILYHTDNIHAINYSSEDNMFVVKKRSWCCGYKELTPVCIGARILTTIS